MFEKVRDTLRVTKKEDLLNLSKKCVCVRQVMNLLLSFPYEKSRGLGRETRPERRNHNTEYLRLSVLHELECDGGGLCDLLFGPRIIRQNRFSSSEELP